ncbi:hypothetical protein EYZ11_009156 [Aspergillus tanneri]|uniref:Uncharacterized protein n=1 Tax=Aspergillus tanneri TaxID=1220188 RepID=A0A4S3JAS9_9EURO|nr:hypothetical protein EYZ11_009156 [Aspergillus tanneri]
MKPDLTEERKKRNAIFTEAAVCLGEWHGEIRIWRRAMRQKNNSRREGQDYPFNYRASIYVTCI